jgi:HEAT repeat protein
LILVVPWIDNTSVISEIRHRDGQLWDWQQLWLVNQLEIHIEKYPDHVDEVVNLLWYADDVPEAVRFAFWSIDRPDDQVRWHHLQPLDREEFRQHLNAVIGADRVYRRLVDLVGHSDADVRVQAVRLLSASVETGEYLFPTEQITPVFVRALDDENHRVRSWACSLFYDYQEGPLPSDVVVRLSQWIADDNETASAAIMVFAMSDMPMQDFVLAASQALESTRELTRKNALRALCIRGETCLPVLRQALHAEADLEWRKWIQAAIIAIENDEPPPRFW